MSSLGIRRSSVVFVLTTLHRPGLSFARSGRIPPSPRAQPTAVSCTPNWNVCSIVRMYIDTWAHGYYAIGGKPCRRNRALYSIGARGNLQHPHIKSKRMLYDPIMFVRLYAYVHVTFQLWYRIDRCRIKDLSKLEWRSLKQTVRTAQFNLRWTVSLCTCAAGLACCCIACV